MSNARNLANLLGTDTQIQTADIADAAFQANKNLIINGAMTVAQRNAGPTAIGSGYYTLDRFQTSKNNDGAFTNEQSTDHPNGAGNSLKWAVTTADTSVAAGQFLFFSQKIEAQDLQHLLYGTSSAKSLTLSFWVKSNKTGTYTIFVRKLDSTAYHFVHEYTISSANTWEKKEITISPTAGSTSFITSAAGVIDNDNGTGLQIGWNLAFGSTYNGATNNAWSSNTNHYATSNQVNWMDSTSNTFYLTEVQLEVGEQATPFEHRSYGDELARCQRYTWKLGGFGADQYLASTWLYFDGSTIHTGPYYCPVQMRADPSLTQYGTPVIKNNGTAQSGFNFTIAGGGKAQCFSIVAAKTSHGLSNTSVVGTNTPTTSDYFILDAEL
jgi:hypothetical protein